MLSSFSLTNDGTGDNIGDIVSTLMSLGIDSLKTSLSKELVGLPRIKSDGLSDMQLYCKLATALRVAVCATEGRFWLSGYKTGKSCKELEVAWRNASK